MLIVETGSGLPNADSYASIPDADAYADGRGEAAWLDLTVSQKEAALRKATDYMVEVYRLRWQGNRLLSTQALDWPREYVRRQDTDQEDDHYYAEDEVPFEVVKACVMLAIRSLSAPLAPDLERTTRREKVDVIETEYAPGVEFTRYRAVDNLLAPFLKHSGAMRGVSRA